eukprot:4629542-Alexandrium_andersonii.AAC.1
MSFDFRALARPDLINHVGKSLSAGKATDPGCPTRPRLRSARLRTRPRRTPARSCPRPGRGGGSRPDPGRPSASSTGPAGLNRLPGWQSTWGCHTAQGPARPPRPARCDGPRSCRTKGWPARRRPRP